jgi:hypothetical protein
MKSTFFCAHCHEDIVMYAFDGTCKCWFCGRWNYAVHECYYDPEYGSDCCEYAMEDTTQ